MSGSDNLTLRENINILSSQEITDVIKSLEIMYPDAECELNYSNPYELLIAVVLSAQTTDVGVNKVTPKLFAEYYIPEKLAAADIKDVENIISTLGLYRNKAKNIIAIAGILVRDYDGEVPGVYDELIKLPGVGRKTANVVLAEAFGQQRIAVDTHVFRVSNRIGLADANDVMETELQLMRNIPESKWTRSHHLLIIHGRRCCNARKPLCDKCNLNDLCKFYANNSKNAINE